jgi:hypothetical protein
VVDRPVFTYLTGAERTLFKQQRAAGVMSWFKVHPCRTCGEETPKSKLFCSKQCFQVKERRKRVLAEVFKEVSEAAKKCKSTPKR